MNANTMTIKQTYVWDRIKMLCDRDGSMDGTEVGESIVACHTGDAVVHGVEVARCAVVRVRHADGSYTEHGRRLPVGRMTGHDYTVLYGTRPDAGTVAGETTYRIVV